MKKSQLIEAGIQDIPLLATHHRKMFEEIWLQKGEKIAASRCQEIENAYRHKLEKEIPTGLCKAWVMRYGHHLVASGALSILSFVPVPNDVNCTLAYLHSIYTEKNFRSRKYARQIVEKAIRFCKSNGINRVILNASDAGKPLYELLGFQSSPETMRLFIN